MSILSMLTVMAVSASVPFPTELYMNSFVCNPEEGVRNAPRGLIVPGDRIPNLAARKLSYKVSFFEKNGEPYANLVALKSNRDVLKINGIQKVHTQVVVLDDGEILISYKVSKNFPGDCNFAVVAYCSDMIVFSQRSKRLVLSYGNDIRVLKELSPYFLISGKCKELS